MWPPGTYRSRMLHRSTIADIVAGLLLAGAGCGVGIALIFGASWWWLLVMAAAVLLWAIITA